MKSIVKNFPFGLGICCLVTACGDDDAAGQASQESQVRRMAEAELEESQRNLQELSGRFVLSSAAPFDFTAEAARLTCQGSFPGNPFRAQWFDDERKIGILVTGFPLDDGSGETRVDNFQVTSLAGQNQVNARLTRASLNLRELSKRGASSIWEVTQKGNSWMAASFRLRERAGLKRIRTGISLKPKSGRSLMT